MLVPASGQLLHQRCLTHSPRSLTLPAPARPHCHRLVAASSPPANSLLPSGATPHGATLNGGAAAGSSLPSSEVGDFDDAHSELSTHSSIPSTSAAAAAGAPGHGLQPLIASDAARAAVGGAGHLKGGRKRIAGLMLLRVFGCVGAACAFA